MSPQLSAPLSAAILMASFLMLCIFVYLFAYLVRLKEKTGFLAGALLIVVYEWLLFQVMLVIHSDLRRATTLTFPIMAVSLAAFALLDTFMLARVLRKRHNTITPMSIKEAVDRLPTGVCLYYPNGLCKLVNSRITEICVEMTGETILNGQYFWELLMQHRIPDGECPPGEEGILIKADSGQVYSVHRNTLHFAEGLLYELTVSDVTEEYRLSAELKEKREQAGAVNRRLRVLGEKITEITREKEILDSKIRLHDEWGRALLLLRKCILNPEEAGLSETLQAFDRNMAVFESERSMAGEEPEQSRDDIMEAAEALGIAIEISGELPDDSESAAIVNLAMVACVSNLAQHARGHLLNIKGIRENDTYRLLFTNDGRIPDGEIKETGGLKNLRRRVEYAGGRMWISSTPRFELWIELGGEQGGH